MAEHDCKQEKVIEIILDKLDSLDSFKDVVTEVRTLVKGQNKHLEKLDLMIEKQNERSDKQDLLFMEISNNMKLISDEQKCMKVDIKELKKDSTIQIKVMPLIKKVILKVLFPTTAFGFLLYELAKALNLIKIGE